MTKAPSKKGTSPMFLPQANTLLALLKTYSTQDLKTLFKVSETIASENYERFQAFEPVHKAMNAYTGYMFKMMDKKSLKKDALDYIESHLMIVSGLYGLVRMTDIIGHYRLPMGVHLNLPLTTYWKPYLTSALKDEWVLDLMSQEYRDAFNMDALDHVTIDFVEVVGGKEKRSAMTLKKCRGLMVRACALNKITKKDALKSLKIEGFHYNPTRSTETLYRFENIKKA